MTTFSEGSGARAAPPGGEGGAVVDLCLTCALVPGCERRHRLTAPVTECELYEQGEMRADHVAAIIDKHIAERGGLMSILEGIQAKYGYLPEGALRMVAGRTGRSLTELYGVATFYKAFSLTPRGRHLTSVCTGTACHVRGAPTVAREFERRLGVEAGGTTEDRMFTLETVNCLGACALGPIVVVDGHYFSQVRPEKVTSILERARDGIDEIEPEADERVFPVEVCCARCNHSLMDPRHPLEGHPSVRVTISFGRLHGWLRLSSLWGSYAIESEHPIPPDTVVNFFCPHCHAELVGSTDCPLCGAPLVPLIVRGGGVVQLCSRRGCKCHMLDLNGVNL